MMRNLVTFYTLAQKAVESAGEEKKITWMTIKNAMGDLLYKLTSMKFQDPNHGQDKLIAHMKALQEEIQQSFRNLSD
jgi:V-type H+-transporting ATPase subunit A